MDNMVNPVGRDPQLG